MSRFLLLPSNNTLSHVVKSLAIRDALQARGHVAHLAVSSGRAAFLERLRLGAYHVLPDIQEADGGPSPAFSWFRAARVERCVRAELDLIHELRPDAVLGVFRFTGRLSATLADVPYHSLICGSMIPACDEVLGFERDAPQAAHQDAALRFFRRACADRLRPALRALGLADVDDAWQLLLGRSTYLWDFPEFQPLPSDTGCRHVGPVRWDGWPLPEADAERLRRLAGPIAYVAFGTGGVSPGLLARLVEVLWSMHYSVALAMGGQALAGQAVDALQPVGAADQRLAVFDSLPAERIMQQVSLLVCHGGQGLVFEALRHRVPVFVLPLQPEQAQNGLCVERLGCGRRLVRDVVFDDRSAASEAAFLARPAVEVAADMRALLEDPGTARKLAAAADTLARYRGADAIATALEQAA